MTQLAILAAIQLLTTKVHSLEAQLQTMEIASQSSVMPQNDVPYVPLTENAPQAQILAATSTPDVVSTTPTATATLNPFDGFTPAQIKSVCQRESECLIGGLLSQCLSGIDAEAVLSYGGVCTEQ